MKYRPSPPLRLIRRIIRTVDYNGARGAVSIAFKRVIRSLYKYGLSGTFDRASSYVMPQAPPPELIGDQQHPFDKEHGTDTGGKISSGEMTAVSLSALHASGYAGIPPSTLRPALAALPFKSEEFTFIDIGCGKGRALLIASEFPFRHVIGVELAIDMAQVARANVALKPAWKERISVANEDALTFELPNGPVVFFLYNPFTTMLLRRFLARIHRQLCCSPRPAFVIDADSYLANAEKVFRGTPRCRAVMASFPFLREVSDLAFPISGEEAVVEPTGGTMTRYTVFSVDVTS